jgi:hypothetical protein
MARALTPSSVRPHGTPTAFCDPVCAPHAGQTQPTRDGMRGCANQVDVGAPLGELEALGCRSAHTVVHGQGTKLVANATHLS